MGLACLLIHTKSWCIQDPPNNHDHGYRIHGCFRRVYWILKLTVDCGYKLHRDFSKYMLKFEADCDHGYRLHGSF